MNGLVPLIVQKRNSGVKRKTQARASGEDFLRKVMGGRRLGRVYFFRTNARKILLSKGLTSFEISGCAQNPDSRNVTGKILRNNDLNRPTLSVLEPCGWD